MESATVSVLELPADATCAYGSRPFRFRHRLATDAAFSADAVARTCERLPRGWITIHEADREIITPVGTLIETPDSMHDVVHALEDTQHWVVVHHLEHVSPYRSLLGSVIDAVADNVDPAEGELGTRGATAFLASPGAVVPAHIDRHHNFLLQIRGRKEFTIGTFEDRAAEAREVERNFGPRPSGSHRLPERQERFDLEPGDGVYIPPFAFHWARGGAGESVAFSCAFRTERTDRVELAYEFNAFAARVGLPRRPPTGSARDRLKGSVVRLRRRTR